MSYDPVYAAKYRLQNKAVLRKKNEVYKDQNINKLLYYLAKDRAKRKEIPFDLIPDDIHVPEVCPILGIPLFRAKGSAGPKPNSPSLDRRDPNQGYTRENTWVISAKANAMKSNASLEELRKFADWVNQLIP